MTRLAAGDPAPDFTLPADGNKTVSLGDFAGRTLVLYLYPRDDTPGCTKEAIGFTENLIDQQGTGDFGGFAGITLKL